MNPYWASAKSISKSIALHAQSAAGPLVSSAIAVGTYATWVVAPTAFEKATEQGARAIGITAQPLPRRLSDGVTIALNREAPPVAALEEALREEPWMSLGKNSQNPKVTAVPLVSGQSDLVSVMVSALNQAREAEAKQSLVSSAKLMNPPVDRTVIATTATQNMDRQEWLRGSELKTPKLNLTREQLLAALFGLVVNAESQAKRDRVRQSSAFNSTAQTAGSTAARAKSSDQDSSKLEAEVSANGSMVVRGHIELVNGLAITDSRERLSVKRIWKGKTQEAGTVWIKDGRFEIFVDRLEGLLTAELRSPSGNLLGRGSVDLQTLYPEGRARRIDGLALRLQPMQSGVAAVPVQWPSGPTAKLSFAVPEEVSLKLPENGIYKGQEFADGSSTYAKIDRKGYASTVVPLVAGLESRFKLMTEVQKQAALTEVRSEVGRKSADTLVSVSIHKGGKPVSGIELIPLTEDAGKISYPQSPVDSVSPTGPVSTSATTTSDSGEVLVAGAQPGVHFYQIVRQNASSDPIALEVFENAVTAIDLDLNLSMRPVVSAFDVFDPQQSALSVNVKPLGHPRGRTVHVDREAPSEVKLASLGLPSLVDVESGPEFVPLRLVQSPLSDQLVAPFIRRGWLDSLIGALKFNSPKASGHVVGFVQGGRFQVEVSDAARTPDSTRIVYFSAQGEPLEQNFGVAGGGFIILGLKAGSQTIVIHAERSDKKLVQDVLVEPGILSTVVHWIR